MTKDINVIKKRIHDETLGKIVAEITNNSGKNFYFLFKIKKRWKFFNNESPKF